MNNTQILNKLQPKLLAVVAAIAIALGGVACSGKSDTAETAKPADAAKTETSKPADAAKSDKAGAAPVAPKAALTVTCGAA